MFIRALKLSALLLVLLPTVAFAGISATSTWSYGTGAFSGYWCYTIDFTWDTPQSLSHLSGFVGLEGLECACDPDLFLFPDPAGTTTGYEDGVECTLEYMGEYLCTGDPSLPSMFDNMAAVKFDPISEPCNAGTTGSGTITFYSLLAPGPNAIHADALAIKNGQTVTTGWISGPLPQADCAVPNNEHSLSALKARF